MNVSFSSMSAIEILDSRGRPTLRVRATLSDGRSVRSGVPSGASTGSREAVELRDHDENRYSGLGVQRAVAHVNGLVELPAAEGRWLLLATFTQRLRRRRGKGRKTLSRCESPSNGCEPPRSPGAVVGAVGLL